MTVGKDGETLRDLATNPVKRHAAKHVRQVLRQGMRRIIERELQELPETLARRVKYAVKK